MMESKFDICIIGGGLWGSAAARYVSEQAQLNVCLIGPKEPKEEDYQDADVLGSHYDAGRIACLIEQPKTVWPVLTHRSICNFRHLEKISGVKFFHEVGCLISRGDMSDFEDYVDRMSTDLGVTIKKYSKDQIAGRFPPLKSYPYENYWYVDKNCGHLSPRLLISAQQKVARSQGCTIIDDTALRVATTTEGGRESLRIETRKGDTILADKVLLCTGAFTNFHDILPGHLKLDLTTGTEMFVKVEIDSTMASEDGFRDMPTVQCENGVTPDPRDYYLLPPIKYPNGKFYMKLGHENKFVRTLDTLDDVRRWYCGNGDGQLGDILKKLFNDVVDLKGKSVEFGTGVSVHTPTGSPYCGMIASNIGVCVGGNACGAGCSDEMGRMGARMIMLGEWNHDLAEELFKPKLKMTA